MIGEQGKVPSEDVCVKACNSKDTGQSLLFYLRSAEDSVQDANTTGLSSPPGITCDSTAPRP